MKKTLLCACLCLALCCGAAAQAGSAVPRAALGYDTAALEKYEAFSLEADSGLWSVGDPLFSALEDAVAQNEARALLNDGVLLWQLRLAGCARTGTLSPALEFRFLAREPVGVRAVSVIVDGKRYDCAVWSEQEPFGGAPAERFLAPLDAGTLDLPELIAASGQVSFLLHGRERVHAVTASRGADGGARERLEGLCFDCLRLRDEMEALYADSYALWDLTAAEAGGAPLWRVTDLAAESPWAHLLPGPGRTLGAGTRSEAVPALQALLRENGFFAGADEQPCGAKTVSAVLRAQRFWGLPETGSADEALLARLNGEAAEEAAPAGEAPALDGLSTARVGLRRWWVAAGVSATRAPDRLGTLSCGDGANRFLVAEGVLRNEGETEIGLGWQLTACAVVDGRFGYECLVRVENGEADGFATALAPLGESRLLLLAEIPAAALEEARSITVTVALGGETREYVLLG